MKLDFTNLPNFRICDFVRKCVTVNGKVIESDIKPLWLVIRDRRKDRPDDFFHFVCGIDFTDKGICVCLGDRPFFQDSDSALEFFKDAYNKYDYAEGKFHECDFSVCLEEPRYEDFEDNSYRRYWPDTKEYLDEEVEYY